MLVKIVSLFLIGMLVLAMVGKLRIPGRKPGNRLARPRKCPKCGNFRIGKGPCACENPPSKGS